MTTSQSKFRNNFPGLVRMRENDNVCFRHEWVTSPFQEHEANGDVTCGERGTRDRYTPSDDIIPVVQWRLNNYSREAET